jgi:hypothetical protein
MTLHGVQPLPLIKWKADGMRTVCEDIYVLLKFVNGQFCATYFSIHLLYDF